MSRVVFLTFNDAPGGIFTSQVIDVCVFLKEHLNADVKLISFVSLRSYFSNRKHIRKQFANVVVLPMIPGIRNWKLNGALLRRKLKAFNPEVVIARGPFATVLACGNSKARICFDARGAYVAEFTEYDVSNGKFSPTEISVMEQKALTCSATRIAVSNALIGYWKTEFKLNAVNTEVIPCTLSHHHTHAIAFGKTDKKKIRIVFSGGNGKWQSIKHMSDLLLPIFETNSNVEITLMMKSIPQDFELKRRFPDRVHQMWVDESEVASLLIRFDYGWLFREQSRTNSVASPVKFAEYLAAGLSVIISEHLGDFSEFVRENGCGIVINNKINQLPQPSIERKESNRKLAEQYFLKDKYIQAYKNCIR